MSSSELLHEARRAAASALAAAALATGLVAPGFSGAAPRPQSEGSAEAQRVWSKLLTRCGDSWFYAGSNFDAGGMISDVSTNSGSPVMEYRGARFNLVPVRITSAESQNGIQYRARITMIAHTYREVGDAWQDGRDLQPRDTGDVFAQALGNVFGDLVSFGNTGAMALDLVRYKGVWSVARASITAEDGAGFDKNFYDAEKLIAAPAPRYDCSTGKVVSQ